MFIANYIYSMHLPTTVLWALFSGQHALAGTPS